MKTPISSTKLQIKPFQAKPIRLLHTGLLRSLPSKRFAGRCLLSGGAFECFAQGKKTVLVLSCLYLPFPFLRDWLARLICLVLLSSFSLGVWIPSADLNHQRGWLVMGWLSLLPKQSFEMELPWSAALLEHKEKDR